MFRNLGWAKAPKLYAAESSAAIFVVPHVQVDTDLALCSKCLLIHKEGNELRLGDFTLVQTWGKEIYGYFLYFVAILSTPNEVILHSFI